MINPNKLGRSPFPRWQAQWMMAGKISSAPPVVGLVDGDPVTTWLDSSGNGHGASQSGTARPTFKTNVINSKPAIRFTSAGLSGLNLASAIPGIDPWTIFAVMKTTAAPNAITALGSSGDQGPIGITEAGDGNIYFADKNTLRNLASSWRGAFHVYAAGMAGAGVGAIFVDGTIAGSGTSAFVNTGNFDNIGWRAFAPASYSNGDIAEILIYNVSLPGSAGSPVFDIIKYLGDKYAIAVAGGGTVIDPTTVPGLTGWWKADSLL